MFRQKIQTISNILYKIYKEQQRFQINIKIPGYFQLDQIQNHQQTYINYNKSK